MLLPEHIEPPLTINVGVATTVTVNVFVVGHIPPLVEVTV